MDVIVYYPKDAESMQALQKRMAIFHAQAVISYIRKLSCPKEQKKQLIKEIINRYEANLKKTKTCQ